MRPVSFKRVYANAASPEFPASPGVIHSAIDAMFQYAESATPFHLEFAMPNGSTVTSRPKDG